MSAAACTCFQSSEESKTRGHHSNTNPKIILQAQTTTDSAQHIMVLRLTFRQGMQIIQVFPALGRAKKLSTLIIAARDPWEKPREASSTVEETTGEEAEGNQRQIKPFENLKVTKTRKFMKSSFCLTRKEPGFLQGTSGQSFHPVLNHWVRGTHPRLATRAPVREGSFAAVGKRQSSCTDG